MRCHHKGVTLTELIIVLIVVSMLAAFGVPALRKMTGRSILAEAEMGMRAIAVGQKKYHELHGSYEDLTSTPGRVGVHGYPEGIKPGQLNGTYAGETHYSIENKITYTLIKCTISNVDAADAPRSNEISQLVTGSEGNLYLYVGNQTDIGVAKPQAQNENIVETGFEGSGYDDY